jgi:hypothetical protein
MILISIQKDGTIPEDFFRLRQNLEKMVGYTMNKSIEKKERTLCRMKTKPWTHTDP